MRKEIIARLRKVADEYEKKPNYHPSCCPSPNIEMAFDLRQLADDIENKRYDKDDLRRYEVYWSKEI